MRRPHTGFTLVELIVTISIIGILVAIVVPSISGAQRRAREVAERKTLQDIQTSWSTWAAGHNGANPIPGLERRGKVDMDGDGDNSGANDRFISGRGQEQSELNDHAAMLSMCIMNNLLVPDQLITPNEVGSPYAYDSYNFNVFGGDAVGGADGEIERWDPALRNDIEGTASGICHNSYAIMPLAGERRRDHWDRAGSSAHGQLSTRGPRDGDETLLLDSNTARLMARPGAWRGFVVYSDGHSDSLDGFYPEYANFKRIIDGIERQFPDNIFNPDQDAVGVFNNDTSKLGGDIYLTHIDHQGIDANSISDVNPYDVDFTSLHD
ncbi:MAG: type II secretion system GspH family protein [Phycisphaerales bacterium]|nr:type II secretion system GspH family protein [Phycisphaerales bacterium]